MKRKLYSGALACALLLTLAACQPTPAESPAPTPTPSPAAEVTPTPEPSAPPAADDSTRYFFADGYFLGAWSNGEWRSCNNGQFTVGEIFNRNYYDIWGEQLRVVRFNIGMADNNPRGGFEGADLLEPFGIIEDTYFIMKLPGQLTGDAAQISASYYNFYAYFDGQPQHISCNVPLESPSGSWDAPLLSDEAATQALGKAGIRCDLSKVDRTAWACDMDSDGEEEYLELIKTPRDENGYLTFGPGEQCFYALLLTDGDQVTVVTSDAISYTDDLTAQFTASDVQFRDLDGDGVCEIIFDVTAWEGGGYYAFSRIDGAWTQVLCSNYGM